MRPSTLMRWGPVMLLSLAGVIPLASGEGSATVASGPTVPLAPVDREGIVETLQLHALPDLIRSLTEAKPVRRLRVVNVTGGLQDRRALPYLEEAYREASDEGVRCKLLESMGKMHEPELFDLFRRASSDPSIAIQSFAIWALGELRTSRAVETLRRKLWSSNRFVQMTVIDALGKTGRRPAVAIELSPFLSDEDVQLRYLAAKALAGVAGMESVPELIARLRQESSVDVQEALARTLGKVGGIVAGAHLIEVLKNPSSPATEHWAEVGLKAGEPAVVVPLLAPLLEGDDIPLKIAASRILAELEPSQHLDLQSVWVLQVQAWSQGSDEIVRKSAIRFIEKAIVQ